MTKKPVTQSRLRELFNYDEATGVFTRLVRVGNAHPGEIAGYLCRSGYAYIKVDGKGFFAHRLAWLYVNGVLPDFQIDHVNRIKSDNRFCNLREVTQSENQQNQVAAQSVSKTGLRGACFQKSTGKFIATIRLEGKQIFLGLFNSAIEAHAAYMASKSKMHPFFSSDTR